jgi:hypothetical protein
LEPLHTRPKSIDDSYQMMILFELDMPRPFQKVEEVLGPSLRVGHLIRIISSRPATNRERDDYEKT